MVFMMGVYGEYKDDTSNPPTQICTVIVDTV